MDTSEKESTTEWSWCKVPGMGPAFILGGEWADHTDDSWWFRENAVTRPLIPLLHSAPKLAPREKHIEKENTMAD